MPRTISFATGCIFTWKDRDISHLIDSALSLDIDGIELTIDKKENLYKIDLDGRQISGLRDLDHVSIHSPFKFKKYSANEQDMIHQLDKIQEIYQLIDAKNVVIHPNELPDNDVLENYLMKFSTENMPSPKCPHSGDFSRLFQEYPKLGLCLDVSHAYLLGKERTGQYISIFKNRITQIHFSGVRAGQDHYPLSMSEKMFFDSIEPIKGLDAPIVIEADLNKMSLEEIKKEVLFVRSLFD